MQNPNWIPTAEIVDSIEVTTLTEDMLYQIDTATGVSTKPDLQEGYIAETELVKATGVVGEATELTFRMTTLNPIPLFGYLEIAFEDDSLQLPEPGNQIVCMEASG